MNKKLAICVAAVLAALIAVMPFISAAKSDAVACGAETATKDNTGNFAATSKAALLIDADSGAVVFEKNTTDRLQIASMVKIMTLAIAFEEIENRGISYETEVVASENAASMGGSQAFLDANAAYRLDELLKSIVVASANDSCVAVAEYLFGSVDAFVAVMNDKAAEWGMTDTSFVNCTGLPKEGQYCCAKDVAVMFKKLISYPRFFDYAKVYTYAFEHPSGRTTELTNTNKLIRFYDGCDGGKTGYTDAARSCITVTAKRGDTRLICVTVGAENSKTRNKEVSELLNYGFANYKTVYAVRAGDEMGEFDVANGKADKIKVVAERDCTVFTKCGDAKTPELKVEVCKIGAPVNKGEVVGEITVMLDGEKYGTVNAVAAEDCPKKGLRDIIDDFIKAW